MIAPMTGPANPLVMILLENPPMLDRTRVMQTLERRHPDRFESGTSNADLAADLAGDVSSGRTTTLRFDGHELQLMTVNAPLPEPILQGAHLMGSGAEEICARHHAHLVVRVNDPMADALACARLLTAVAGAFISSQEQAALGALWDGKVITDTAAWQHLSPNAYKPYPDLPVDLWIRILRFPVAASGQAGFLTRGLDRFAGWELEMTGPDSDPRQLALRVRSVARHLVQNGPIFRDGLTYQISPTEQLTVQIGVSTTLTGVEVMSATLSLIEPQAMTA